MKKSVIIIGSSLLFIACANIAKGLVAPNQCKKCEVYDIGSGAVLDTYEGCGGSNVRLEEDAKVAAFDLMRGGNTNIDVRCETWKQEPAE